MAEKPKSASDLQQELAALDPQKMEQEIQEEKDKKKAQQEAEKSVIKEDGQEVSFTNIAKNIGSTALIPGALLLEAPIFFFDAGWQIAEYAVEGKPISLGRDNFTNPLYEWSPVLVESDEAKKLKREKYEKLKAELEAKQKAEKEKAELAIKERAARNRLGEQTALILSLEDLLNNRKYNRKKVLYRNFGIIRSKSENEQTIQDLSKVLTKRKGMHLFYRNLPNAVLSALVPSIKIYKVFYPQIIDAQKAGKDAEFISKEIYKFTGFDWRIPFDDTSYNYKYKDSQASEFLSGEYTLNINGQKTTVVGQKATPEASYTMDRSATSASFDNKVDTKFFQPAASMHAVGIKSFSYSYDGTDPFSISTNIAADLELYFRNVEDILKKIEFSSDDERFVIQPENKDFKYSFSYSDLVYPAPLEEKNLICPDKKLINPHYYTLKVVVGYEPIPKQYWNILKDSLLKHGYSNDEIPVLKDAIDNTQQVFVLNPYQQDLTFNDDGSVGMKIKCNAMVNTSMALKETDIFLSSEESKQIKLLKKEFENWLKANDKERAAKITKLKETNKNITPEQVSKKLENFDKEVKRIEKLKRKKLENSIFYLKKDMYNNFYRRFLGIDSFYNRNDTVGLYSAYINTNVLGLNKSAEVDKNSLSIRKKTFNRKNKILEMKRLNVNDKRTIRANILNSGPPKEVSEEAKKRAQEQGKDTPTPEKVGAAEQKALDKSLQKINSIKKGNENYSKVKFLFLGDIIDIAAECINNDLVINDIDSALMATRMVLGEIPVSIPTAYDDTISKLVDTNDLYINIADIPISFEYFQQFMLERIVQPMREAYPLIEFIRDIVTSLIKDALSPSAFGETIYTNTSKLSTKAIQYKLSAGENNPLTDLHPTQFRNAQGVVPAITDETINKLNGIYNDSGVNPKIDKNSSLNPINGILNYYFIFASFTMPKNTSGDRENDEKSDIYHLVLGSDGSLIKKMSFSKTEVPGAREYAAEQLGMNNAIFMKQVYNANISLFGNNVFNIGDYIYIEPIYSFGRRILNLQDSLGLGGYYFISNVKGTISDFQFTTDIKCIFQLSAITEEQKKEAISKKQQDEKIKKLGELTKVC